MAQRKSNNKKQKPNTSLYKDKRLEKRGSKLENKIVKKETVIINQLSEDRAELVSYCRFMKNEEVNWEKIYQEKRKPLNKLSKDKHVLVVNDTTEFNYECHRNFLNKGDKELGPLGNDKDIGFFCHPGLVIDSSNGVAIGYSYLKIWNRSWDKKDKYAREYKKQAIESKESYRWIECGLRSKEQLSLAKKITIIADRESDIYEEFAAVPDNRTELLIRSRCDRFLYDGDSLYKQIEETEICERYDLKVRATATRKARNTNIEVKYIRVKIKRPSNLNNKKNLSEYVELTAIEAKELSKNVPKGEKPIHWILLTTHKINGVSDALQIIVWYCMRWQIELLFATMKSKGLNMEASELESGKALKTMCVIALHVSLLINQLRQLRNDKSGIHAGIAFTNKQIELLKVLAKRYEKKTKKQTNPHKEETIAWASWIIARLGGWKGYACECPPGNKTYKWGLDSFYSIYEGFTLNEKICA